MIITEGGQPRRPLGQSAEIGVATPTEWLPNLISGNTSANVFVNAGGADTVISGNYIGVDSSGVTPLPSAFGIYAIQVAGLHIGSRKAGAFVQGRAELWGGKQIVVSAGVYF